MVRRMFIALLLMGAVPASAQVDARMFRQPAVSADKIAFVYAGDIWLVPKSGGGRHAPELAPGEESFPRFSPDGSKLAYSADYDGNTDVYVVPTAGGEPVRLTHHPMGDRVIGWHPDGKRVLFASGRESGRQRYSQFYLVGLDGGLPEKLPVPYGEFGAFSPDGASFVYMPMSQDFRNWKRYRGGWAPDLWLFDLKTFAARNITNNPANDAQPMWFRQHRLLHLGSRRRAAKQHLGRGRGHGRRPPGDALRRLRHHVSVDRPGRDRLSEGRADLPPEPAWREGDRGAHPRCDGRHDAPRADDEGGQGINAASVSPTGRRAVFEARGDVVTLPAERGAVINVTRSSGVADRYPRWSPDGKTLAYWSDRSGEYELTFKPADGTGAERKVTSLGRGFRYAPQWSPDNMKVAFIDQAMRIRIYDDAAGKVIDVDKSPDFIAHDGLEAFRFQWSARLAVARLRAAGRDGQQRHLPVRYACRTTAAGDDRLSERDAADLRSRRKVSVLCVRPRVRPGVRHVRQHVDVCEPDTARRGPAAPGREVASRCAQRRRELAGRREKGREEGRREEGRRQAGREDAAARGRRPLISIVSSSDPWCCRRSPGTTRVCTQ